MAKHLSADSSYPEQQPPPVAKRRKKAPQYSNIIVDPTSVLADDAVRVSAAGKGGATSTAEMVIGTKNPALPSSDFASSVLVSPANAGATTNTSNAGRATSTYTAGVLGAGNSTTTSFNRLSNTPAGPAVPGSVPSNSQVLASSFPLKTINLGQRGTASAACAETMMSSIAIDMSITLSEKGKRSIIKDNVREKVFRYVKFYNRDRHGFYSNSPKSVCGMLFKFSHMAHLPPEQLQKHWINDVRKLVIRTISDHRNNCIKAMKHRFKGKCTTYLLLGAPLLLLVVISNFFRINILKNKSKH